MNPRICPNSPIGFPLAPVGLSMALCTEIFAKVLLMRFSERESSEGLKRSELARHIGITPSAVTKLFRGKTLPSAETLDRLSSFFGVKVHTWFIPPGEEMTSEISPEEGLRVYLRSKGYILKAIPKPRGS